MSGFRGIWIDLLSTAVDTARAVLRDLDPPEVPSPLRRVAAYSGGQLPPPLATSLLSEIDRNEWFRQKAAEAWDGDDTDPAGPFLLRPDGWWLELAAAAIEGSRTHQESRFGDLQRQLEKTAAKVKAAVAKSAELNKELIAARQEAKESAEAIRASVEARYADVATELAAARSEGDELSERLESLAVERAELQEAFVGLRSRLARARRQRLGDSTPGQTSRSAPTDPVKLARMLDLQAASFGRNPAATPSPEAATEHPLSIEPGVRPDSSDGIRWLLDLDRPTVVLVDGYNAQFHVNREDFTSGAARRNLVEALQRLRAAASVPPRIVVIYDSALPGERDSRTAQGGVEVRFAEEDLIADEEVVAMAGELTDVVVISSDREVREGSEDEGAVVLWSEALSDWLRRS